MKRAAVIGLTAFAMLNLPVSPAKADPPDSVLLPTVTAAADYLGGLGTYGRLGQSLPLTSLVPGGADGIALQSLYSDLGTRAATATDLNDLKSKLTYHADATPALPAVDVTATLIAPGALDQVNGLRLQVHAVRTVEAPLALTDPAQKVDLTTKTPGVPLVLDWTSDTTIKRDLATGATWIDANPVMKLTTAVAPTPFADPKTVGRVGVAEVSVTPSSTMTLTATLTAVIDDDGAAPGDGRLYFMEPTSAPGVLIPGELTLPLTDNVAVTRTGTVAAALGLTTPLYKAGTDPGAVVTVASSALTDAAYAPAVSTNAGYGALKAFTNVTGADLLGGLGQLVAGLTAVQRHKSVDLKLPFLDGTFADTAPVAKELGDFVVAQTLPDDPATTTVNEFGQARFATVDEMFRLMKTDVPSLQDDDLAPSYDPTTAGKELTFRLHLVKAAPATATDLAVSPYKNTDGTENPIGRPNIGSALRATAETTPQLLTGLSNLNDPSPYVSGAKQKSGYTVDVLAGVLLRDAVPCSTPCDTDASDGFDQTDDLPPFLRWFVRTGGADTDPEVTVDTTITSPLSTKTVGRAGFAQVTVLDPSTIDITKGADATKPTLSVQIKPSGSGDANLPLKELLTSLNGDTSPLVTATRSFGTKADLKLDVRNGVDGTGPSALPGPAHVVVSQTDGTAALAPTDVKTDAGDASAAILTSLDYNLQSADALAGKYLSVLDSVMDTASSISSAIPTDILGKPLPTLGTTPASLFSAYASFKTQIQAVRAGAIPPSLQAMNAFLQSHLGDEGAVLTFSLKDFGDGEGVNVISRLHVDKTKTFTVPLSIDTPTFDIASLSSSGQLNATVRARGDIAVPISLKDAEPNLRVLDSARLQVDLDIQNSPSLELKVNLAGIQGSLGPNGVIKGGFKVRAHVDGSDPSFADLGTAIDQSKEHPVALTSLLGKLKGEFLPPTGGNTCQAPAAANGGTPEPVTGAYLCAEFPVKVNGAPLVGDPEDATHSTFLKVAIDDPTSPSVTFPTGLDASYLAAQLLDFGPLKDGLAKLTQLIGDGLDVISLKGKLPLIGEDLQKAAQAAQGLDLVQQIDFQGLLTNGLNGLPTPTVADLRTKVLDPLAQKVVDTGVLRDTEPAYNGDSDTVPSKNDVRFDLDCDPADGIQACNDSDPVTMVYGIQVQAVLGQGDNAGDGATAACPAGQKCSSMKDINLGLPAINLKMTGGSQMQLDGAWELELGFGYDKSTGFFLMDNPLPKSGVEDSNDALPELSVGLHTALPTSFAAKATLAFLSLDVTDDGVRGSEVGNDPSTKAVADTDPSNHRSEIGITGKINIQKPGGSAGNDRIAGGDFENLLSNLGTSFKTTVAGNVNIDLHLKASADGLAKGLPAVVADLLVSWSPSWTSGGGDIDAGNLNVAFNNVGVDLGAILRSTIGGAIGDLYKYTKPLDPIREFLFSPIPVVSDLSTTFGGPSITFFDLLKAQQSDPTSLNFLQDVNTLLDLIKTFASLGAGSASDPAFIIGSFGIPGTAALGPPQIGASAANLIPDSLKQLNPEAVAKQLQKIGDKFVRGGVLDEVLAKAQNVPAIADAINAAKDDASPDFTFPLFEDPSCVFGMLLGANCVIAQWSPDDLSASFHLDLNFGPFFGVLYVTLSGYAEVQAHLTVGYDTQGLLALLNGGNLTSLFDGFFLGDLDPVTKADRPELVVKGGIAVGGKVSVVIAEAGVEGGVDATFNADLRDGGPTRDPASIDGVIRIDEISAAIKNNILCLFDFSGYLEAFLRVYATLGVCPFCYTDHYDLARVRLLDFSGLTTECNPEPPELMHDMGGGTWRLNVGPAAGARGTLTSETAESFVLTQRNDGSVAATAFGFTEVRQGVKKVIFDFGGDKDSLAVKGSQASSSSYSTPDGQAGSWTIPLDGTMGADDDAAVGGEGADRIDGGGGNDRIELRGGNDTSDGGDGIDQVFGGSGNDGLTGGADDDTLDGGLGGDTLDGQGGNDRLLGGQDTPRSGTVAAVLDGDDIAYGGAGNDFFDLGNGNDKAYGDGTPAAHDESDGNGDGSGADEINLGPGDDKAWGGGGGSAGCQPGQSDILRGGDGVDELHGQGGVDCLYGEKGADKLFGGPDNDYGDGGDDNDRLDGNDGNDRLLGGNGNDTISGNAGEDNLLGGANDDDISGGLGTDTIDGEAGLDWIAGDDSSVSYPGGVRTLNVADDQATGDKDTLLGGPDADRIRGEGGDDTVDAGTGDDDVAGNAGNDTVRGNDGLDTIRGNVGTDSLYGGPADDLVIGDADKDLVIGDGGDDRLIGGSASLTNVSDVGDQVYGGVGNDILLGDNGTIAPDRTITLAPSGAPAGTFGADVLTGDDGDDVLYAQDGNDFAYGGNGADRAFGGLGADYLDGQNDADFLVGDQGVVSSTGTGVNPGGAPKLKAVLTDPSNGGIDTILGGNGDDHAYGGAADDLMSGGLGDDYLEGNEGADTVDGLVSNPDPSLVALALLVGDDDDIVGGSSSTSDTRAIRPDVGEVTLRGGPGGDVVAGDNADITRTASSDPTKWVYDYAQLAAFRTVKLLDTEKTVAQLTAVSGPDTIRTGLGNDIAFGEGGDDVVDGEDGNDVLVGNQGHEVISGGTGQDDLVGGSMADAGVPSTGRPDVNDELYGGPDEDVLVGDNANVVRTIAASAWAPDPLGAGYGNARVVTLYDLGRPAPKTDPVAGSDLLLGEAAHDSLYGQAENDTAKGGPGDDLVYGGQGSDLVEGNDGEDDLVGGSYVADEPDGGDRVQGGGGADVLMGDNGIVDRGPLPAGVSADRVTATVGVLTSRKIRFLDINGKADTSGRDLVAGGEGADIGFGQDKDDQVLGGTGQDQLEGMGGADIVLGDSTTSVIAPEAVSEIAARGGILPLPAPLPQGESAEPLLSGAGGTADQDDIIGGTAKAAALDSGDLLVGEGGADFLLGDNGTLARTVVGGAYTTFTAYDGAVQRKASRFDVNGATTLSGPDVILGGDGNDRAWGQDQDDRMYGGAGNDDLLGELGADKVYGEAGEDALVGDRGSVLDTEIRDDSRQITASLNGPTKDTYVGLRKGTLDRRVSLTTDLDGSALAAPGTTFGGNDVLLGGDDHDVIHAGAGDDVANGEYGGDWLFGDLGRDVMWGGRGAKTGDPNQRGTNDTLVDYLFGGGSGDTDASTADILDVRPRPGDPTLWFQVTNTLDDDPAIPSTLDNNQHHHGIDWIYGGSGRDVMQADVGQNGPDGGDRLRDWLGNYNLYLHCHASYGGDQDVRQHSPAVQDFLYAMAFGSGAGLTPTEVSTVGTSGDYELSLRAQGENGKPMDGNPGHFDQPSCQP